MDRLEFEALRDLPGKVIQGDIRFSAKGQTRPLETAEVVILGTTYDLRMNLTYNVEVRSKTINVHVAGMGAICRLDVDGKAHRPAGRQHKHSVQTARCIQRGIPDGVIDRPDLAGKSFREVFEEFCRIARIEVTGTFIAPDEGTGT